MPDEQTRPASGSSRGALAVAALLSALVGTTYIGHYLFYPFTLLATWVHETGHGLTAIALGGRFERLEIFWNAAGLAHTWQSGTGPMSAAVALGGLLGPPLLGALVLGVARGPRRARVVLALLSLAMLVTTLLWVRTTAGLVAVPLVAAVGLVVARFGSPRERVFLAQFIGLRLALDTLGRGLDYLFTDGVLVDGQQRASDIANVAAGLGGPRLFYSVLVAGISIVLVATGLYAAWRRGKASR